LDNGPSRIGARGRIMLAMNPATTAQDHPRPSGKAPPRARRLVLVPAASGRDDELVRRYRLARLRLEARDTRGEERFAHLKQFHD
jgi:hypothetical protein